MRRLAQKYRNRAADTASQLAIIRLPGELRFGILEVAFFSGVPSMWIDRQDFLYTIRSARRAPLLSIIAVAALSLGIGLNAGVFTLLNALFLSPPTEVRPSSFLQLYPRYEGWFTGAAR